MLLCLLALCIDLPEDVFAQPQILIGRLLTVDELNQRLIVQASEGVRYIVETNSATWEPGMDLLKLREQSIKQNLLTLRVTYKVYPVIKRYGRQMPAIHIKVE